MVKSKKQDSLYGYVVHRQEQEQSLALLENKIIQEMILEHLHKGGSFQYGRFFVDNQSCTVSKCHRGLSA